MQAARPCCNPSGVRSATGGGSTGEGGEEGRRASVGAAMTMASLRLAASRIKGAISRLSGRLGQNFLGISARMACGLRRAGLKMLAK